MAAHADKILKQFADQATACEKLGSPFTARLCRVLSNRLDTRSRFGTRILEWPGDPYSDNVALRAAGALHALARTGWEPGLGSVYPPNDVSEHTLWVAIVDALSRHDNFLTERLSSPPQTNEVARSAIVLGAMLTLAAAIPQPLDIYEIGASAGLNLGFDDYRYNLGDGRVWGPVDAPLSIECAWRGGSPPLEAHLDIIGRHGCDLRPIEANNAADRERLLSYVWADQTHRLLRIDAALKLAAAHHRTVDRADAADWLEMQFAQPQDSGVTRVLFHTIVWQYLPPQTRTRIEQLLDRLGALATRDRPLARLSVEADETPGNARIDLTVWPGGKTQTLGRGDFHGRSADWAAG